jgi:hypothetical protein
VNVAGEQPADRIIREIIHTGRPGTPDEIDQILVRMATVPFDSREARVPLRRHREWLSVLQFGPAQPPRGGPMAQVAASVHARIEHSLKYLLDEWTDIPELASEWSSLERYERLDFIHEWPIRESYMAQLQDYAERGLLTPAQRARYDELLKLVERHRPTLATLLKG